jgi:serine/threonine protein kinase
MWECVIQLRLLRRLDEPLTERARARARAGIIDAVDPAEAAAEVKDAQRVQHNMHTHATHLLFPLFVLRYSNATVLVMPCAELGSLFAALLALHGSSAFSSRDREVVVASLTAQMLAAVQLLHDHDIIHTDIKNDNWCLRSVVCRAPSLLSYSVPCPLLTLHSLMSLTRLSLRVCPGETRVQLCLIDFGKAKDLRETQTQTQTQAQQAHAFRGSSAITAMTSPEMLRGQPWIYHADYFAVSE